MRRARRARDRRVVFGVWTIASVASVRRHPEVPSRSPAQMRFARVDRPWRAQWRAGIVGTSGGSLLRRSGRWNIKNKNGLENYSTWQASCKVRPEQNNIAREEYPTASSAIKYFSHQNLNTTTSVFLDRTGRQSRGAPGRVQRRYFVDTMLQFAS